MWTIQEEDEGGFTLLCGGNFVGAFETLCGVATFLERQERRVMMENATEEDRRKWILAKARDNRS